MTSTAALVVFSGGQDSTTCLYWALKFFDRVFSITFDYGQRHRREIAAAQTISEMAGVPNKVLEVPAFQALGGSSLTGELAIKEELGAAGLPNTFVPGRNIIFLAFAAAYAYQLQIKDLVAGVCQTDYSGYPDCRRDAIEATALAVSLGMDTQFVIHTPLMFLTKAESVTLAKEVGALNALSYSHTCYQGLYPPCGSCAACKLRANGFQAAGIADPLIERCLKETDFGQRP